MTTKTRKSSMKELRQTVARIRHTSVQQTQTAINHGNSPIRIMAKMVNDTIAECQAQGIPSHIISSEVVNRSIGDIDVRRIVEQDNRHDYRTIGDLLGVALPREDINGYQATGKQYLALREHMMDIERMLLQQHIDLHIYDIAGTGNIVLRQQIAEELAHIWNIAFDPQQILLSTGSLDGIDKAIRGLRATRWTDTSRPYTFLFPTPSFGVPMWQAKTHGLQVKQYTTSPANHYKLTANELQRILQDDPTICSIYLTISNNPTAYSYSGQELQELLAVVIKFPQVIVLADMAYTGTGNMDIERERVSAFHTSNILPQTIFCWSLSKVYTMTGDRFGYLSVGDPAIARDISISWVNGIASLPAEWQLRFAATFEHLRKHPEIREIISDLYTLRRAAMIHQLKTINATHHIFDQIQFDDGGTVYNWSTFARGETVFSLFEKTGIAGVPGSAFGYADDHMRLSVGIMPVPGWEQFAQKG